MVKHSGGKLGKAGKTLSSKSSSKSSKSKAGKTLKNHQDKSINQTYQPRCFKLLICLK